jgi:glycosyltransferase involved in cell wall biosynthesis
LTFDALLLVRAALVAVKHPPHLIHAFLHEGAWIGHILSQIWKVPLVFDYQGSLTGEMLDHGFLRAGGRTHMLFRFLEHRINALPDVIVTSSVHALRLLKRSTAGNHPAVFTIPDSVDTRRFRPLSGESPRRLRSELGLPFSRRLIVYLGKLAPYQGTGLLLQAAAELGSQRDDIHFLIMGYPDVEAYRMEAEQLGIARDVTFTGRIPYEEAAQYLTLADVAVAPKISETESNGKLLNYMAMGLPTVAFDTPVAREYLGNWGQYAFKQDGASLAAAIEALLDDQAKRRYLGTQLRERARQLYSWENAGERLEHIYTRALSSSTENGLISSCSRKVKI